MLDANKKREMMEEIVKNIMQRMKEQGMSDKEILKTIEKISKQAEEDWPTEIILSRDSMKHSLYCQEISNQANVRYHGTPISRWA